MRMFITCGNLHAGGAERVISILANKFTISGICIELFTWYKTDAFYHFDERIVIHQIPIESRHKDFLGQMRWFRKEVQNKRPEAVLSFLAPFNILTVFSLIGVKIPVLVAERNDPNFVSPKHNGFWKIIRNVAYSLADGVLVQTVVNKSHFPKYIQRKATIIYNPVTFSKEKIGLALVSPKRKYIVSVTRLEKQKNVPMLIDAFAKFYMTHPEYSLIIYGEGNERENLEQKIKLMNLQGKVFLPGRKQNVHELIVDANIFAMASNFEGMSNSLIEAMCLGLPCISTKVSGAIDLIKSNENGILVDIGNPDQLAEALTELADNDNLRQELGQNAIKLYDKLRVDIIAQQWLNYIMAFINEQN